MSDSFAVALQGVRVFVARASPQEPLPPLLGTVTKAFFEVQAVKNTSDATPTIHRDVFIHYPPSQMKERWLFCSKGSDAGVVGSRAEVSVDEPRADPRRLEWKKSAPESLPAARVPASTPFQGFGEAAAPLLGVGAAFPGAFFGAEKIPKR